MREVEKDPAPSNGKGKSTTLSSLGDLLLMMLILPLVIPPLICSMSAIFLVFAWVLAGALQLLVWLRTGDWPYELKISERLSGEHYRLAAEFLNEWKGVFKFLFWLSELHLLLAAAVLLGLGLAFHLFNLVVAYYVQSLRG